MMSQKVAKSVLRNQLFNIFFSGLENNIIFYQIQSVLTFGVALNVIEQDDLYDIFKVTSRLFKEEHDLLTKDFLDCIEFLRF